MPSFPGGDAAMMAYLRDNIVYPASARETNIMGTVALRFVVGVDGSISDIAILKDPGGGCGKEAVRVLKSMPTWIPGEANGNPVKVRFTMPVRFILQ
jgi:protein TonB